MPYAIDQDALNSPNLKMMDINKPPMRSIPFQEYPKMLYLHPLDKTKEHRHKIVQTRAEEEAAVKQGYRLDQHIPQEKVIDLSADFEFEAAPVEPAKRKTGIAAAAANLSHDRA